MTTPISKFESPIDAMYLIHKALRAEAAQVEALIDQLEEGGSLQPFKRAFYRWGMALGYHAEIEETCVAPLLAQWLPVEANEAAHRSFLLQKLEDIQTCLTEEIGRTLVIARTQRHLFGKVVQLRIAQDDHLEDEEAVLLPVIRQRIGEAQQLQLVGRLLIDQDAEDQRWYLDWLNGHLTPCERQWLVGLSASFREVFSRAG